MARGVLSERAVLWNQFFVLQEIDSQIDHLREELRLASLLADSTNAHLDAEIARARRDEGATQEQLELRQRQRDEAAALLPGPLLAHYQRLRKRHKSRPWVVRLSGSSCPACNLALPSKLVADVLRTGEPAACPSCARLLIRHAPEPIK